MPRMMRINSGIFCALTTALSLAVACSWGGSGSNTPQPDASTSHAVCGDGTCAASEVNNCPADCGQGSNQGSNQAVCGNGSCETTKGETAQSCPSDCNQGSGSGSGSSALNCSDPNTTISCLLCTQAMLCTPPYDAISCAACGGGGFGDLLCENMAADGVCNAGAGEDHTTCPSDCP